MKRHKVILEVEVYVEDDESTGDAEARALDVAECIREYIGHGASGDPRVGEIDIVSVDKEPLPPTEDELKEASRLLAEKAQVDEFLAKAAPGTFVVIDHWWRGILTVDQPDGGVSILDRRGNRKTWSRREGFVRHIMVEELLCGHGHSRMNPEECAACNRNAKYIIEGVFKRDVM